MEIREKIYNILKLASIQSDSKVSISDASPMACSGPDPYEQQLLAVFESCCERGETLDSKGLSRLCEKLQLEEQAPQLLERLLGRGSSAQITQTSPITFPQFRDALLALLAGVHHVENDLEGSPDREVRPKFVLNKKKYGRRSRPENSDSDQDVSESDSDGRSPVPKEVCVAKTLVFSGEITPRKRKTSPEKNPRSPKDKVIDQGGVAMRNRELTEEEESLRVTWESLSTVHEGHLGCAELRLVCEAVGLGGEADELVQQIFQRLGVDRDGRISFDQFLQLFRSGLHASQISSSNEDHHMTEEQRSLTFHNEESNKDPIFLSLDTVNAGALTSDQLLSLWEARGVSGASQLLHDLGLTSVHRPMTLVKLSSMLEEEALGLVEETRTSGDSRSRGLASVLHASIIIHQAETKCLKSALEQVQGERDKLRQDVSDANERAAMIAQEVDDRHARLEQASLQQARSQEQKHNEEVRALEAQLSLEREQLAALTTGLELKLGQMQAEETRLRNVHATMSKKCEALEKETANIRDQLVESEKRRTQLQLTVDSIPQLELRLSELEAELAETQSRTIAPLQEKVEKLTLENRSLRDANDELTLKLEDVNSRQVSKTSVADEPDVSSTRGRRRRPGVPSSEDSSDDDSLRMGKQRRHNPVENSVEDGEELTRLRARIQELEGKLAACPTELKESPNDGSLDQVKMEIERLISERKENNELRDSSLGENSKSENSSANQSLQHQDPPAISGDADKLRERVTELEQSLELMREEYERCEDYWQGKLEEERRLFEQEQASTDERYSQLMLKINEYGALLCQEQTSSKGGRLSPIDESFALEKQVTDLEEECLELQLRLESLTEEHSDCHELKQALLELKTEHSQCRPLTLELLDAAVQTEPKQRTVSLLNSFSNSSLINRDKHTQVNSSLEDLNRSLYRWPGNGSSTRHELTNGDLNRVSELPTFLRDSSSGKPSSDSSGEQSCRVQLTVMQSLTARLNQQEQRNRRLEALLTQHQSSSERLEQQLRNEINALQAALKASQASLQQHLRTIEEQAMQLMNADLLVKDLFSENSLLVATVERLEHHCATLIQQAPGSA